MRTAVIDGADAVVGLVVLVLAALLTLNLRRRALQRNGGTFDAGMRESTVASGKGWMLGIARYTGSSIDWYRVFSLSPRPRRRISRADLVVVGRRVPLGAEAYALLAGAVVIECVDAGQTIELGMTVPALTGFLAWLEAAPPGQAVNVA